MTSDGPARRGPPIGTVAMTGAQRQKRYRAARRARMADDLPASFRPATLADLRPVTDEDWARAGGAWFSGQIS